MRLKPFKYINGEIYYQCNVCKDYKKIDNE